MAMPRVESQPDAVDKIYAQSLFELIEAQGGRGGLDELNQEIEQLSELVRTERGLAEFMGSRIIGAKDKIRSLRAMFGGRVSPVLLNFLLVLARKERLNRTLQIFAAFDQMMQDRFGRIEVDLYTRHPLAPDQVESIRARLRDALKREPVIHSYTDAAMIGGIKMQVGDKLIDASVATRLRRMRELLITDGASEVRARFDRIVEDRR